MHRSGTTLLSRILEELGIFMGARKDSNNEATFFLKFNKFIFEQAGACWDNPYNYRYTDEDFKEFMANLACRYLSSVRRIEFLGFKKFFKYKSVENIDFPWGWKDPRNSFTLDIWLKIFPNAKIIHIYRNPIDVAESLRKRSLNAKKNFNWNLKSEIKYKILKYELGYGFSWRVLDIKEGVNLWAEYIENIVKLQQLLKLNIFHIKYEDLLEDHVKAIKGIIDFVELKDENIDLKYIDINANRKFAFLENHELVEFYRELKNSTKSDLLKKLGYFNIV